MLTIEHLALMFKDCNSEQKTELLEKMRQKSANIEEWNRVSVSFRKNPLISLLATEKIKSLITPEIGLKDLVKYYNMFKTKDKYNDVAKLHTFSTIESNTFPLEELFDVYNKPKQNNIVAPLKGVLETKIYTEINTTNDKQILEKLSKIPCELWLKGQLLKRISQLT